MRKRWSYILILILMSLLWANLHVIADEPEATETPAPMQSLFEGDTCAPPCWFGLTPGVSTSADVLQLLLSGNTGNLPFGGGVSSSEFNVFDPETGDLIDGDYLVSWSMFEFSREDFGRTYFYIVIQDSMVYWMAIQMNRYIYLGDVLARLGEPDHIVVGTTQVLELDLIYFDPYLKVSLIGEVEQPCYINDFMNGLNVDFVTYYSPEAALEPSTSRGSNILQPKILAYTREATYRPVARETWETWINGEGEGTCGAAWDEIIRASVLPEPLPTPEGWSPEVTPTPTPESTAAP